MRARLVLLLLVIHSAAARAEAQPPDFQDPDLGLEIWGPIKPLPNELRPDVDWKKALAGCKQRKVVSQDKGSPPTVQGDVSRAYDGSGRLVKIEKRNEAGKVESTITFAHDDKGRVARRLEVYAGSGSIGSYTLTESFAYDAAGRLEHVVKQESGYPEEKLTFSYDAAGRLLSRTDAGDKGSSTWKLIRSPTGALLGLVTEGSDGKKQVVHEGTADAKGRPARVKTPPDTEDELSYDAAGREIQRKSKRGKVLATVKLTYDAAGRLVKIEGEEQGPDGGQTTLVEAVYDAAGRMTSSRSSRAMTSGQHKMNEVRETAYSYDGSGRLVAEKEKAGGGDGQHGFNLDAEVSYRYDGKGRLVEAKSHAAGYPPLDRTTTGTYSY